MALRRRSSLERRVIAMLRGEEPPRQVREGALALTRQGAKSQGLFFAELRRVAGRRGLAVQPPGARILSDGELTLLAWLAQEQRVTRQGRTIPADPLLIAAVARCAGMLDAMGLHLSPHTLHGARRRGAAPTDNDMSEQAHATRRIAATIA
jgi:hypothetical protein